MYLSHLATMLNLHYVTIVTKSQGLTNQSERSLDLTNQSKLGLPYFWHYFWPFFSLTTNFGAKSHMTSEAFENSWQPNCNFCFVSLVVRLHDQSHNNIELYYIVLVVVVIIIFPFYF